MKEWASSGLCGKMLRIPKYLTTSEQPDRHTFPVPRTHPGSGASGPLAAADTCYSLCLTTVGARVSLAHNANVNNTSRQQCGPQDAGVTLPPAYHTEHSWLCSTVVSGIQSYTSVMQEMDHLGVPWDRHRKQPAPPCSLLDNSGC